MTQSLELIVLTGVTVSVTSIENEAVEYEIFMTHETCEGAESEIQLTQYVFSQPTTLVSMSGYAAAASLSFESATLSTVLSGLNIESNAAGARSDCVSAMLWGTSIHPSATVVSQPDGIIIELGVNELFPSKTSSVFKIDGVATVGVAEYAIELNAYLGSPAATALDEQLGLSNTREVVVCVCDRTAPSPVISLEDSSIESLQCLLRPPVITPSVSEVTICLFSRLPMVSIRSLSIRHQFGPALPLFANGFNMIPSNSKSKLSRTRGWVRVILPQAIFNQIMDPTEGLNVCSHVFQW